MSHFIIDGYNALFGLRPLLKNRARSREGFLLYIKTARPFGSIRNKVTVVFDGRQGIVSEQRHLSPLRVIFSKVDSADETIVRMVSRHTHPGEVIVVSDDRELCERVKLLGGRTVSVTEFFSSLTKKKKESIDEKPAPASKEGKAITDEMKKEWKIDD
jgi:predicted RNA-binding protein with PIN domain